MMGTGFLVAGFALGAALWQTGGYALVIPTLALLGGLATLIPGMRHANGKLRAVR
jgi:hypothetical protein